MPADPARSLRVLIVDEFAPMRKLLRDMLDVLGYRDVTEAADGDAALVQLLATGLYGLVIADWDLPGRGGFGLLVAMHADESLARIPFVMMFSGRTPERGAVAPRIGAAVLLDKPFNTETLKAAICAALAAGQLEHGRIGSNRFHSRSS